MSRRQQLMWRYGALCTALVVLGAALVVGARKRWRTYTPGEKVEGITEELARTLPAGYPRVTFTDVTAQAGIGFRHFQAKRSTQLPEDMGSGAAWGDYDNDGYPDLYVVDIAAPLTASPAALNASAGGNRLYHNNRDGTFRDVTAQAGVGLKAIGMGAAWADFDNDGRADLVVTTYGSIVLYRNRGDGTFEDVSRAARLDRFRGFWTGASWGDYDRDGRADLYICGYVQYAYRAEDLSKSSNQYTAVVPYTLNPSSYTPERNLLFHNNGDGSFSEVGRRAGVDDRAGRSLSASWADFDGDGWPDLYVANDVSDNALYLNLHNGRFKDASQAAWVADYRGAMGLAVGDWDRDGDTDIFITHWIAQQFGLFSNLRFTHAPGGKPNPALHFQDVADIVGVGQVTLSSIGWGTSFFDLDNDGQLDIFAANGSTFQREDDPSRLAPMKSFLFWQKGPEEGFFDVGSVAVPALREAHVSRGAAFADYDNDGDVDVFVVNHQGAPMLLRNDGGSGNHWIKVRVRCARSNRSGLGARIEVEANGAKQYQELGAQSSYLSQNFAEAHFGLGRAESARRVTVVFPSGVVKRLENVPVDRVITVDEGAP